MIPITLPVSVICLREKPGEHPLTLTPPLLLPTAKGRKLLLFTDRDALIVYLNTCGQPGQLRAAECETPRQLLTYLNRAPKEPADYVQWNWRGRSCDREETLDQLLATLAAMVAAEGQAN